MAISILMPALSPTMTHGNLVKWHKRVGDTIKSGDLLAEIETDKATMEIEAADEGVLGKILVPEGSENVAVNTPIGLITAAGEALGDMPVEAPPAPPQGAAKEEKVISLPLPAPEARPTPERILASPLAKRLAQDQAIDLSMLQGSGPHGRIVKRDVLGYQAAPPAMPTGPSKAPDLFSGFEPSYKSEKLSSTRRVIAERLTLSKQTIPHFYISVSCNVDPLLAMRRELQEALGAKVSVNDLFVKMTAQSLEAFPFLNAAWGGDHIRLFESVDVAVAVAVPGGLVTPVVRNAPQKGLLALSAELKELIERARAGKLKPMEYQGGTFTISNMGMYGVSHFAPIINPPQAAILGIGSAEKRPLAGKGDTLTWASSLTLTLAVDHRVVDGAMAADFLANLKKRVENPLLMAC